MLPRWPSYLLVTAAACTSGPSSSGPLLTASGTAEVSVRPTVARAAVSVTTHASQPASASHQMLAASDGSRLMADG